MSKKKEPWEKHPDLWKSQASFFTYLRGQLRQCWSRYPAKLKWKQANLVLPPQGYTGRAKKLGECYYCNSMFAASHLEVDHKQQAGQCNSWETASQFLRNLLDCNDNWVLACKPCHKIKSHAEKKGISFEEARLEKRIIEWMKKSKQEIVAYCKNYGYNELQLNNEANRRKALEQILRKEETH